MNSSMTRALACSSTLLLLGATMDAAEAMSPNPVAGLAHGSGDVVPAMYGVTRKRHATHHNAPNKYCQNQPSRC